VVLNGWWGEENTPQIHKRIKSQILSAAKHLQLFVFKKLTADASPATAGPA
jgi:hypothetical protein